MCFVYLTVVEPLTDRIDARQLLRELHHHADGQGHLQRRGAHELHHGDVRLSLVGRLLRPHLLDVLLNVVGGAEPAESCGRLELVRIR